MPSQVHSPTTPPEATSERVRATISYQTTTDLSYRPGVVGTNAEQYQGPSDPTSLHVGFTNLIARNTNRSPWHEK